jgi:anti-anti-sigma regulatory factor
MTSYTCSVLPQPANHLRIELTGDIDFTSRVDLDAALRSAAGFRPRTVDADLSEVAFFSAEGAAFLLRLRRYAEANAVGLLLQSPPSVPVLTVLDGLLLTDAFVVAPSHA